MLTQKNAKAYAILAIVIDRGALDSNKTYFEPYLNGREEGFAYRLYANGKKAAWATYRNSDSIVVYIGKSHEFSMQGNSPDEEVYGNKVFFGNNEYIEAAEYIMDSLTMPRSRSSFTI